MTTKAFSKFSAPFATESNTAVKISAFDPDSWFVCASNVLANTLRNPTALAVVGREPEFITDNIIPESDA